MLEFPRSFACFATAFALCSFYLNGIGSLRNFSVNRIGRAGRAEVKEEVRIISPLELLESEFTQPQSKFNLSSIQPSFTSITNTSANSEILLLIVFPLILLLFLRRNKYYIE